MMKRTAILLAGLMVMLTAPAAGAYDLDLGSTGRINIHGFITQGYMGTTDNNFYGKTDDGGSFQFNERAINFTSQVSDRLSMGFQVFSRDLGNWANNEVTFDWAYADYTFTEWANLKAGKIKMTHGLYNTSRDVDMLRTSVFLPQSVYNEGWRDSINALDGFELYGYVPMGVVGSFDYHLQAGVVNFADDGPEITLLQERLPKGLGADIEEINTDSTYAGSFLWDTPLDGLRMGASGWLLTFDSPMTMTPHAALKIGTDTTDHTMDVTQTGWTTSVEYAVGDLVLAAEYNRINYDFEAAGTPIEADFDSEGYYGSITYRITDWFEVGSYYSEYYADTDDRDGEKSVATWEASHGLGGGYPTGQEHRAYSKDLALSLRFDITENWILKMEGHKMEGAALMFEADGNVDDAGNMDYEKDWYLYTAKVSFSF